MADTFTLPCGCEWVSYLSNNPDLGTQLCVDAVDTLKSRACEVCIPEHLEAVVGCRLKWVDTTQFEERIEYGPVEA